MRNLFIHFHIFKNAGSTIDKILLKTFDKQWVTFDNCLPASRINHEVFENFVTSNPNLLALSSHQLSFPVPRIENINIIPIVFFRHPIDRVRSVYYFERQQGLTLGPVSRGADHASRLSFAEYLRWRLDDTRNGVVHNHQTVWMNYKQIFLRYPISHTDFDYIQSVVARLPFFGIVERFDDSLTMLKSVFNSYGFSLNTDYTLENRNQTEGSSLNDRLDLMRSELEDVLWTEILNRNEYDRRLYEFLLIEFEHRLRVKSNSQDLLASHSKT